MRRRRFLTATGLSATFSLLPALFGIGQSRASTDPRPEFASTEIEQVLNFYFGASDSEDDASIEITIALATESRKLVPFKVRAPGAEKIALLTDANPQPLIMAMDQIRDRSGTMIGQARLHKTGSVICYALRDGSIGRASRRVQVSGHWN